MREKEVETKLEQTFIQNELTDFYKLYKMLSM